MEGAKVFIDPVVLEEVEKVKPPFMTRTAWINYLLQLGVRAVPTGTQQPE